MVSISGQQPVSASKGNGLGTARGTELAVDIARVFLHRAQADKELVGDVSIGVPGGQVLQDLQFPSGRLLDQARRAVRRREGGRIAYSD